MKNFIYEINCVSANGDDIIDMVDNARQISYRTFCKHIKSQDLKHIKEALGYGKDLSLKRDWAVSFYKSKYKNKPCYYLCHSMIEYVFVPESI
jgi:hypothetical protein